VATPRTLIVIPAYNEEAALPGVLSELAATCPAHDVLVVVDGATDSTAAVARGHGVAVAELPFNLGIGGALQTGFRFAVRHGYDRAVQFDADGQHDATSIDGLLRAIDSGLDLVIGSRFGDTGAAGEEYAVGKVRGGAMAMLRLGVRLTTGARVHDASSGFRGFSQPLIRYFAVNYPVEYMDSVESLLLARFAGFRVGEVSVHMRERTAGIASQQRIKLVYHFLRVLIVMLTARPRRSQHP
jgi:glycosyltransferase involved in cell wall biosynthesis